MDKRFKFFKKIGNNTITKIQEQKGDLITYCLEELQGCEKLYGLMFIFTEMGDMEEEDKELIRFSTTIIIGDMLNLKIDFINHMVDNIVDSFYSFDRLRDGYLVNHNFVEMEKYLKMRKSVGEEQNN